MKSPRYPTKQRWYYTTDAKPTAEDEVARIVAMAHIDPRRQPPPRRAAQAARRAFERAFGSDPEFEKEDTILFHGRWIPTTGVIVISSDDDDSSTEDDSTIIGDGVESEAKRPKIDSPVDRQVRLGRILHTLGEYGTRAGLWRKPVIKLDAVLGVISGQIQVSSGEEALLAAGKIPVRFNYSEESPRFA